MKNKIVAVLTVFVLAFTAACGQSVHTEVIPLDEGSPPVCVTIEFSDMDEWDSDKHNIQGATYCQKEN